ncbi:hypothetical protein GCM10009717_29940 [Agromyces allii]|uniref:Uncharacterized protein n=1 Tax=Agromyces allii TaxID=393607 RepID=A0ABN2QZZ4_9MICO
MRAFREEHLDSALAVAQQHDRGRVPLIGIIHQCVELAGHAPQSRTVRAKPHPATGPPSGRQEEFAPTGGPIPGNAPPMAPFPSRG